MEVIMSADVRQAISDYTESLTEYPISTERARQKIANMKMSLQALGTSLSTPSVCMSKDLLQTFDDKGNPLNKNLKRFNYKDESGFQWSFACLYDYENDTITILKMMAARFVKDCVDRFLTPILEFNKRLIAIR